MKIDKNIGIHYNNIKEGNVKKLVKIIVVFPRELQCLSGFYITAKILQYLCCNFILLIYLFFGILMSLWHFQNAGLPEAVVDRQCRRTHKGWVRPKGYSN